MAMIINLVKSIVNTQPRNCANCVKPSILSSLFAFIMGQVFDRSSEISDTFQEAIFFKKMLFSKFSEITPTQSDICASIFYTVVKISTIDVHPYFFHKALLLLPFYSFNRFSEGLRRQSGGRSCSRVSSMVMMPCRQPSALTTGRANNL